MTLKRGTARLPWDNCFVHEENIMLFPCRKLNTEDILEGHRLALAAGIFRALSFLMAV